MNAAKEAGKLGAFTLIVALLAWLERKTNGTWFGNLLIKGENSTQEKDKCPKS